MFTFDSGPLETLLLFRILIRPIQGSYEIPQRPIKGWKLETISS